MKLAVPKETVFGECRVALSPEAIKRLISKKFEVVVQAGAGIGAHISDAEFTAAGATLAESAQALCDAADLVVKVQPPSDVELSLLRKGSGILSLLYPMTNPDLVRRMCERELTVLAADMIPRTTLAQMMDVLSSQATIAGYRAALLAAEASPKLFPMMMTAAGTIAPAKVLVLGAGVAGLQAIATARRLGAVVEAFDVRRVVKEQVESLGARFIEVGTEDAQGQGGYARELSEDDKRKQADVVARHLAKSDACITTAQVPGRPAPTLITAEMVHAMRPGSIIVDAASDQGGNCALTAPGERRVVGGVTIIGERNLPSQMASVASAMYGRNMEKLLLHVSKEGTLELDPSDEIARGLLIARGGQVVHAQVAPLFSSQAPAQAASHSKAA
jgi:H+-translocating NAD(P) transhydrogenase subunit alpha